MIAEVEVNDPPTMQKYSEKGPGKAAPFHTNFSSPAGGALPPGATRPNSCYQSLSPAGGKRGGEKTPRL